MTDTTITTSASSTARPNAVALPLALSVNDVAKRLSTSRATIYGELQAGRLKAFKLGKKTLIRTSDLEDFLNARPAFKSDPATAKHGPGRPKRRPADAPQP